MHLPNHCSCFTVLCCITLRCLWLVRQVWYWSSELTGFTRGFTITIFVCWNWIWRLRAQRLINELLTSECVTWFILLSTPRRTVIKNGHCVLLSNGAASLHTNTTRQTHSRWWEKRRVSVCTSRSKIYSAASQKTSAEILQTPPTISLLKQGRTTLGENGMKSFYSEF